MKNKPRLLLAIVAIIMFFCFFNKNDAFADKQYLDLSYHKVRYTQEDGKGTTIWYAVIPAKYKMHYAYAQDIVWSGDGGEKPSENARRHGATIAVNSQLLGFPTIDGAIQYKGADVSGYDFSIEKNPNSVAEYDVFNIYANSITDPNNGISFYGVNLGFDYYGNYVQYNGKNMFMALYSQIVQDGTVLDFNNINSRASEYGTARHPRTWLTYDSQGNQYVAVAAGRNDGTDQLPQAGLSYEEIYDATRQFLTTDIYTLYNLDGGGSCGFIYKGTKISPNYDNNNTTERNVFGIFYWKVETQVVSFEEISITKTYGDASFISAATTTGDGAITYSSSDNSIAEINSQTGEVTIKKAGEVTITATAAATDVYNSASSSYTLTINKHTPTISFANNTITKTYGDVNFINAATTTGDGTISYSSSDSTIAEVNSETGEVAIKSAGEVIITAYVAATTNCTAASTSYTLTINKADRTISFADSDITKTFGDANFTNIATTTGDGAITYSSSDANIASVNKNTGVVTIKKAGEVTITANVAATNNYNSASTSYTLTINKADRTISFTENSITKTYGDANFTNAATANGDGVITYSSNDNNIAEINPETGEVTIKKAGEVTIRATAEATENYTSASTSYTLTINKRTATVSFENNTITKTYGDANFTNTATTNGDGAITYSSSDTSIAEVNSETGEVTIKAAGEVTIRATAEATENYTSASTSYTLTVDEHNTTISFENTHVTKTYGDANFTNIATTTSDGAITYSSSDTSIAEVNSETGEVTIRKAGEVTITASVTATNYEPASASYMLTINKYTSTVSFENTQITKTYGNSNFTNAAEKTGDGEIAYSSSDPSVAEVNSETGEVTIKSAGEVIITATIAATTNCTAASTSYTLTINKADQTISFADNNITKTFGDANFTNTATTNGDGAITYSSSDTSIAEVNSETGEVTIKAAGEVTIRATAEATENYTSASTSYTLTINKHTSTISFANSTITKTYGNANFTNIASTTSDGVITYESSNPNVATVNNTGVVTIKSAGEVTITASVAATNNYTAASTSYTLIVNKADRIISFANSTITRTYGDANFTNIATTTGDGTITYASDDTSIAEVNPQTGEVTIKKAGEVTITASVAATNNYTTASTSYTLIINKTTGTVSFENAQVTRTYGDANFTNIADTTSDGAITYTSSNTNIAEVDSQTGEVTIKSAGETTITATVAATNNYTSASASYTLTVNKHTATISFENTHITKTYGDANFTNIANTTSDGTITYASDDTSIAEVNSQTGEVTIKKAGKVTITATVAAANYDSASASYTLTIHKKTSQAPTEISELKNGYVADRLSSINLSTPGLAWVNPEENIEEGSHFYQVSYTEHNDTTNYTTEQYEITVLGERREYTVIEGDKQTFIISEDGTATFKINADYELFGDDGEIYIDDILVERKNYDAESGSTIIRFHHDFISTLALGEHTFTAIFNDGGIATANFALEAEDPIHVPDTGNNTSTGPELKPICAVATIIIAILLYLYRKKTQKQKEHLVFDKYLTNQ